MLCAASSALGGGFYHHWGVYQKAADQKKRPDILPIPTLNYTCPTTLIYIRVFSLLSILFSLSHVFSYLPPPAESAFFFPGCTGFNQDATPEVAHVCLQNKGF